MDMYSLPQYKTINGLTASQLIDGAKLQKMQCGDWRVFYGDTDLELDYTDAGDLVVCNYGYGLCTMLITNDEYYGLKQLTDKCGKLMLDELARLQNDD